MSYLLNAKDASSTWAVKAFNEQVRLGLITNYSHHHLYKRIYISSQMASASLSVCSTEGTLDRNSGRPIPTHFPGAT